MARGFCYLTFWRLSGASPAWNFERIGLEADPLSQWLYEGLAKAGLPVICIETRHAKAFLKAQPNKTDRNDARGIAQMMRGQSLSARACEDPDQPETPGLTHRTQPAARRVHQAAQEGFGPGT